MPDAVLQVGSHKRDINTTLDLLATRLLAQNTVGFLDVSVYCQLTTCFSSTSTPKSFSEASSQILQPPDFIDTGACTWPC